MTFALILAVLVGVGFFQLRHGRNLKSPRKELLFARLSLIALFITLFVVQFASPDFSYYVDTSRPPIESLEDARVAIERSNELNSRIAHDLKNWSRLNSIFSFVLVALTLSSLLGVTEALASERKENPEGPENLIRIFDDDKQ